MSSWARYTALAPDGSSLVYRDTVGLEAGWQLWVKERGSTEGRPLPGTANARDVVFSPDGRWIAYAVEDALFKREIDGPGSVRLLEDVTNGQVGLSWTPGGTILVEQQGSVLVAISEDGGSAPDTVFTTYPDAITWVEGLPGGDAALVVTCPLLTCTSSSLVAVDLETRDATVLLADEVLKAWYLDSGHIVWVSRAGAVYATPFDPARGELRGGNVSLLDGVRAGTAAADMVLGRDGTVLLVEGAPAQTDWEAVWVDREGRVTPLPGDQVGNVDYPTLSPDGTELAVEQDREIWIVDLERGARRRLTFDTGRRPAWTPDGRSVLFDSDRGGGEDLWARRADGSGEAELLLDYDRDIAEASWARDSTWLIFRTARFGDDSGDILGWRIREDSMPTALITSSFQDVTPVLSPDGRFLAYVSRETGRYEVYVVPFPDVGGWREQVSVEGGREPLWSHDGSELFYRNSAAPDGDLIAVEVDTSGPRPSFQEQVLFDASSYRHNELHQRYSVSPDGRRFIFLRRPPSQDPGTAAESTTLILNWFTEVGERLASGG